MLEFNKIEIKVHYLFEVIFEKNKMKKNILFHSMSILKI
jgi:hypothetical protein